MRLTRLDSVSLGTGRAVALGAIMSAQAAVPS